ncbi:hypothetical protein GGR88_002416 [Sphingomonas jejuensis]|uniref:Ice-binding protein C-terminal domain-containing protein n=1 Tax=Sphingomonas jejuensis TaxID=904715 RepID=A0ABX0XNE6_9SPHN|nr:PEPxxWA-CTERM sorting domain-containing protein [Sphingomonas jejuensis]NJC34902.1 hypothetical protein [Sphingomonas jejuensis]
MTIVTSGARLSAAAMLFALPAAGQAAVVLTGTSYSTDFNTLISSGSANAAGGVVANGWQFLESEDNADTTYTAGTGSDNQGNTYSFGAANNADRAFGTLSSGSLRSAIGVVFNNQTGSTINALSLNFFGEQYRNGSSSADSLIFEYLVGGTNLTGTSNWVRISALDVLSTVSSQTGVLVGNNNRTAYSGTIGNIAVANGGSIALRWSDFDASGAEDALAIDDFSLTATLASTTPAVPEPATWAMMIAGFGLVGSAMRRRKNALVSA